jgi:hypothetical protein
MAPFDKGDQTRVNDTLNMIQNAPDLTGIIRTQIVTMVNNTYPRLTQANRQAYHQLSINMSVRDNIAAGVPRGTQAQRELRRAIYLLWMTIGKVQNITLWPALIQRMDSGWIRA